MPEISLSAITSFLQEKGADRLAFVQDPNSAKKSVTVAGQQGKSASNPSQTVSSGLGADNDRTVSSVQQRGPYAGSLGGDSRIGFILTSDVWRQENRALLLHAGPSSASWTLAMRASEEPTKAGHARFAQVRTGQGANRTYFEVPTVEFEFQSGNIMPIPLLLNEVQIPHGLDDFHLFTELLNQPPLIPDGTNEGQHNYVWIFYTSLQFPQIVLKGYFDPQGISWTDSSETPTSFTWQASFTVHEMTPNLWERSELVSAYTAFMRENVRIV